MKKFVLLLLLMIINYHCLTAQKAFSVTLDNLSGLPYLNPQFCIKTQDKGYMITGWGSSTFPINFFPFLMKVDSIGTAQFMKYYTNYMAFPTTVVQTLDSGYLLGLDVITDTANDLSENFLLKLNSVGDIVSTFSSPMVAPFGQKTYIEGLKVNRLNGNILLKVSKFDLSYPRKSLTLYDSSGNMLFSKYFAGPSSQNFLHDFSFVYNGSNTNGFLIGQNGFLTRVDNNGVIMWQKSYYDITNNNPIDIYNFTSTESNIYTTGRHLQKLDSLGNPIFCLKFDSLWVNSVSELSGGSCLAYGYTYYPPYQSYLFGVDSIGGIISASRDTSPFIATNIIDTISESISMIKFRNSNAYLETFSLGYGCSVIPIVIQYQNIQVVDSVKSIALINNILPPGNSPFSFSSISVPSHTNLVCNLTDITSITNQNFSFSIYPNPTTNFIQISLSNYIKPLNATLTDINGGIVSQFQIRSLSYRLNMDGVRKGIYLLEIENMVKKVVVL